jgi:uncharacterized protein YfbU (UPF0304 family)
LVICTDFSNGKNHDFNLFRESLTRIKDSVTVLTDSGYVGIDKLHNNSFFPVKRSKHSPLIKEEKSYNRFLSSERVLNEHVIGMLKRFRIILDTYRNRRRRFGLRFNLIAGVYNYEIKNNGF